MSLDNALIEAASKLRFASCPHGVPDSISVDGHTVRPLCDACVLQAMRDAIAIDRKTRQAPPTNPDAWLSDSVEWILNHPSLRSSKGEARELLKDNFDLVERKTAEKVREECARIVETYPENIQTFRQELADTIRTIS